MTTEIINTDFESVALDSDRRVGIEELFHERVVGKEVMQIWQAVQKMKESWVRLDDKQLAKINDVTLQNNHLQGCRAFVNALLNGRYRARTLSSDNYSQVEVEEKHKGITLVVDDLLGDDKTKELTFRTIEGKEVNLTAGQILDHFRSKNWQEGIRASDGIYNAEENDRDFILITYLHQMAVGTDDEARIAKVLLAERETSKQLHLAQDVFNSPVSYCEWWAKGIERLSLESEDKETSKDKLKVEAGLSKVTDDETVIWRRRQLLEELKQDIRNNDFGGANDQKDLVVSDQTGSDREDLSAWYEMVLLTDYAIEAQLKAIRYTGLAGEKDITVLAGYFDKQKLNDPSERSTHLLFFTGRVKELEQDKVYIDITDDSDEELRLHLPNHFLSPACLPDKESLNEGRKAVLSFTEIDYADNTLASVQKYIDCGSERAVDSRIQAEARKAVVCALDNYFDAWTRNSKLLPQEHTEQWRFLHDELLPIVGSSMEQRFYALRHLLDFNSAGWRLFTTQDVENVRHHDFKEIPEMTDLLRLMAEKPVSVAMRLLWAQSMLDVRRIEGEGFSGFTGDQVNIRRLASYIPAHLTINVLEARVQTLKEELSQLALKTAVGDEKLAAEKKDFYLERAMILREMAGQRTYMETDDPSGERAGTYFFYNTIGWRLDHPEVFLAKIMGLDTVSTKMLVASPYIDLKYGHLLNSSVMKKMWWKDSNKLRYLLEHDHPHLVDKKGVKLYLKPEVAVENPDNHKLLLEEGHDFVLQEGLLRFYDASGARIDGKLLTVLDKWDDVDHHRTVVGPNLITRLNQKTDGRVFLFDGNCAEALSRWDDFDHSKTLSTHDFAVMLDFSAIDLADAFAVEVRTNFRRVDKSIVQAWENWFKNKDEVYKTVKAYASILVDMRESRFSDAFETIQDLRVKYFGWESLTWRESYTRFWLQLATQVFLSSDDMRLRASAGTGANVANLEIAAEINGQLAQGVAQHEHALLYLDNCLDIKRREKSDRDAVVHRFPEMMQSQSQSYTSQEAAAALILVLGGTKKPDGSIISAHSLVNTWIKHTEDLHDRSRELQERFQIEEIDYWDVVAFAGLAPDPKTGIIKRQPQLYPHNRTAARWDPATKSWRALSNNMVKAIDWVMRQTAAEVDHEEILPDGSKEEIRFHRCNRILSVPDIYQIMVDHALNIYSGYAEARGADQVLQTRDIKTHMMQNLQLGFEVEVADNMTSLLPYDYRKRELMTPSQGALLKDHDPVFELISRHSLSAFQEGEGGRMVIIPPPVLSWNPVEVLTQAIILNHAYTKMEELGMESLEPALLTPASYWRKALEWALQQEQEFLTPSDLIRLETRFGLNPETKTWAGVARWVFGIKHKNQPRVSEKPKQAGGFFARILPGSETLVGLVDNIFPDSLAEVGQRAFYMLFVGPWVCNKIVVPVMEALGASSLWGNNQSFHILFANYGGIGYIPLGIGLLWTWLAAADRYTYDIEGEHHKPTEWKLGYFFALNFLGIFKKYILAPGGKAIKIPGTKRKIRLGRTMKGLAPGGLALETWETTGSVQNIIERIGPLLQKNREFKHGQGPSQRQ